ncbi:glycosyltransferase family 4 protein [Mucilaginibacter sp. FT3.2]|uniref:glycosyltransferase family 4 protein n=1 Tax=Mucilaginibacter sp. FT3.2 TaxID=2723090 RepID=UPI00161F5066|nr:glycosyltransferase family 4 protein [Mucilaginibacter sp. FT3.2]MBB6233567.1 glycosyltransferase involved in cell wall biosynthesis [Mucilaginibacter sp. FT3.2]
MTKPKALVILTPGFPADGNDTTCIPAMQVFVRALKQSNPQLHIIVVSFQYPFTASRYYWYGVEVIALAGKGKGQLFRLITWQRVWQTLKKLHQKYELAGLLSFWIGECAYIGNRFAKKYSLPHHIWMLGQDAKAGNEYVNRIKPKKESLIAISDFLANEFRINYGILPAHVIPSGIDVTLFNEGNADRDIDILGAGSLIPLKQYHLFVNIVKSLITKFPDVKAVICGKGPEMDNLKIQIAKLKLENNILLRGELPHPEVLALMQRSKVFLHTSLYEGYSTVLSEALYAGCHAVSLVKGMNNRPAQHHVPDNAEHLPDIIKELLKNKKLVHEPVLVYPVESIAAKVAALFGH